MINFEINVCPECGGKIKTVLHNGITLKECMSCNFSINMTTGKVEHHKLPEETMLVLCPKCGGKHRIAADPKLDTLECNFCGTEFTRPSVPDQNIDVTVSCTECNAKNRVKANRGTLLVTCNRCGKEFRYDSGVSKIPGIESFQSQREEQDEKILDCPYCDAALNSPGNDGAYDMQCPDCGDEWIYECDTETSLLHLNCKACGAHNLLPSDAGPDEYECVKCAAPISFIGTKYEVPDRSVCDTCGGETIFTTRKKIAFSKCKACGHTNIHINKEIANLSAEGKECITVAINPILNFIGIYVEQFFNNENLPKVLAHPDCAYFELQITQHSFYVVTYNHQGLEEHRTGRTFKSVKEDNRHHGDFVNNFFEEVISIEAKRVIRDYVLCAHVAINPLFNVDFKTGIITAK